MLMISDKDLHLNTGGRDIEEDTENIMKKKLSGLVID